MMLDELGSVYLYGRLRARSRADVSAILVNGGARLVGNSGRAQTVVVAHRALPACLDGDRLRLPFPRTAAARLMSEDDLDRRITWAGATAPGRPEPYTLADVARLADLPADTCEALALFDVIGRGEASFAYRDLAAARQVGALRRRDVALPAIIRAAWTLAARGVPLSQVRLVEAPWGEIMHEVGGGTARLDGQFALVLDEAAHGAGSALARATAAEGQGDLPDAERWYRRAAQDDRSDPVPPFNLGNVLAALGRDAEAMIALQQALARDPTFAEASFNLAGLYEKTGQRARAVGLYREAVAAHPDYPQALYNLARLMTLERAFAEALPLWERFIALAPNDPDVKHARRGTLLCRMELR